MRQPLGGIKDSASFRPASRSISGFYDVCLVRAGLVGCSQELVLRDKDQKAVLGFVMLETSKDSRSSQPAIGKIAYPGTAKRCTSVPQIISRHL